jgi:transketolase
MSDRPLPRDAFIDTIFEQAVKNRNIIFISADLGAKALDRFRTDIPDQFIHAGICEQNMMDLAAGLAQNGKIVFVYAMGPFVTVRCLEQIKVALASMHLPCCIIGNGVGYSYDDAGPTHYATEDVTCMRSIAGCEVLTVGDTTSARLTAMKACSEPALRYVRLDRTFLPDIYPAGDTGFWEEGIRVIAPGKELLILSNGFMVQKALKVRELLAASGVDAAVGDVFRIEPIDGNVLRAVTAPFSKIATIEEHFLNGGTGAAIAEAMADHGITKPLLRLGIPADYRFDNGGRELILKAVGLGVEHMAEKIALFASNAR